VLDLKIHEGQKISPKEIHDIFALNGFELSDIQAQELLIQMDHGRNYQRQRMEKWVYKNGLFLARSPDIMKLESGGSPAKHNSLVLNLTTINPNLNSKRSSLRN
jgi:hypothetical protein